MEPIIVIDGGFSTQLAKHVGEKIDGDPLWTARFLKTHPKSVLDTHLDFLRAGAVIIQTNTYQASIEGFIEHLGITKSESLLLIHESVELAKEAVKIYLQQIEGLDDVLNNKPLIAGSCGPYGASLHDGSEYTGEYSSNVTKDFLINWHKPRLEALINAGIDLLALETIPSKIEAEALVELLKDYPNIKAWLAFSCCTDGRSIVDGSDFRKTALDCYKKAIPGQIVAVGVNCIAPTAVSPLLQGINVNNNDETIVPLIVYPNSGETYTVADGWKRYGTEPPLENFINEWLDLGVRYVGGCCRTQANDIAKINIEVLKWQKKISKKSFSCFNPNGYHPINKSIN